MLVIIISERCDFLVSKWEYIFHKDNKFFKQQYAKIDSYFLFRPTYFRLVRYNELSGNFKFSVMKPCCFLAYFVLFISFSSCVSTLDYEKEGREIAEGETVEPASHRVLIDKLQIYPVRPYCGGMLVDLFWSNRASLLETRQTFDWDFVQGLPRQVTNPVDSSFIASHDNQVHKRDSIDLILQNKAIENPFLCLNPHINSIISSILNTHPYPLVLPLNVYDERLNNYLVLDRLFNPYSAYYSVSQEFYFVSSYHEFKINVEVIEFETYWGSLYPKRIEIVMGVGTSVSVNYMDISYRLFCFNT